MICLNALKTISKQLSTKPLFNSYLAQIKTTNSINIRYFHKSFVSRDLMEFFDDKKNWSESEVKSGREWRKDELRIKSNTDLHKLWYVLYKERNMLKTMQEYYNDESETFPSPERIDKVEQSMQNLEDVVRERNKAYWELQVGEGTTGERPKAFRKDMFGRWRWIGCSEHLIPYRLNTKWRSIYGPGFGHEFIDLNLRLREKQLVRRKAQIFNEKLYVRQILRRFPDADTQYLQELYPEVDVKDQKENLVEYISKMRMTRFHTELYKSKK